MTEADSSLLSRFVHDCQKRFRLSLLAASLTDGRLQPRIPARPVILSLVLGEVARIPSLLQLQEETKLPEWRRWVGGPGPISHDTFGYVSERLDFEPMRQGEEECAAALRLLRRLRATHGPRFFDVAVVDSWYAKGPFLKTVAEELGWPVIAVLKQERFEVHQEALALSQKKPDQVVERNRRRLELWDVRGLRFSDSYETPVRVVRVRETWIQREQRGQEWVHLQKEQNWLWVVAGDLAGYDCAVIRDIGHSRWKIENHAFGQLTQHWHLTHCSRHHPVAVVALLWIKLLAFTLFHAFAILHGKLYRMGKVTFQELRQRIYRSLFCGCPLRLFSG